MDWVIFLCTKRNRRRLGGKFDSSTNQNYMLTDYILSRSFQYVKKCDVPEVFARVKAGPPLRLF